MPVMITARARAQFDRLQSSKSGYPRIEILAGGCNGFEKVFSWSDEPADDDIVLSTADGKILIDPTSHDLLDNAIVDYVSDLAGSMFVINIPEAASTCGCGASFSL